MDAGLPMYHTVLIPTFHQFVRIYAKYVKSHKNKEIKLSKYFINNYIFN